MKSIFLGILLLALSSSAFANVGKTCSEYKFELIYLIVFYASDRTKIEAQRKVRQMLLSQADEKRYLNMVEKVYRFPQPSVDAEFDAIYDAVAEQCEGNL